MFWTVGFALVSKPGTRFFRHCARVAGAILRRRSDLAVVLAIADAASRDTRHWPTVRLLVAKTSVRKVLGDRLLAGSIVAENLTGLHSGCTETLETTLCER
jgi:hypothetical protein